MTKLRVHNLSISLDGYVAGPDQSLEDPLGKGGERLHEWMFVSQVDAVDQRFLDRRTDGVARAVLWLRCRRRRS